MSVLRQLADRGAVCTDRHFVYTSGKHGPAYINLDPVLPDVALMTRLCRQLAAPFVDQAEIVAAPAVGGIVLAALTAQALSVPAVWADKTDDGLVIERAGFAQLLHGRKVLVVEDLLTTGGSVVTVCDEVTHHGASIVGVAAICNRGRVTARQLAVPRLHTLADVDFAAYPAEVCPLCMDQVPIVTDVGHGEAYRGRHPGYPGGFQTLRVG